MGEQFGVKGFPTLKFFHNGEVYDYAGGRSKEAISAFALGGYKSSTGSKIGSAKAAPAVAATPVDKAKAYVNRVVKYVETGVASLKKGNFQTAESIIVILISVIGFQGLVILALLLTSGSGQGRVVKDKKEN